MSKRIILALFLGGLLLVGLAACTATTPVATIALPPTATKPAPTATPSPTRLPATATAVPSLTPSPTKQPADDNPTPTPVQSTARVSPTPTLPWQIPAEVEGDWTKGGQTAGVIIVEYGDYQ